jgi:hypothetical protein
VVQPARFICSAAAHHPIHRFRHVLNNCNALMFSREAGDVLALVDSGDSDNYSSILNASDQSSKFRLLLKHCSLGGLEHLSGDHSSTRVDICRVHLRHAVWGDRVLQAVSVFFRDMHQWGQSGGSTKCKWVSNEEAKNQPHIRSIWLELNLSSPPPV